MSKTKRKFWDDFRFEFNFYINDNIICQRKFNIRDYNEEVLNSLELNEMMRAITGMNNDDIGQSGIIPTYFKELCRGVSWKHYNPWRPNYVNSNPKGMFENEDTFIFEVRVDKNVVAKSQFSGNWFQTDIRSSVNIKEIIPDIIAEIDDYMSRDEYTLPLVMGT